MPSPSHAEWLEEQISQWRSYLRRRQAIHSVDVAELEDHLREQVAGLVEAGLATDEAFLVAVKRMGDLDALSREFAREHSERLWKQLVVVPSDSGEPQAAARTDAIVAFCLAVAAAVFIKVPVLFGLQLDEDTGFYLRNLSLFVLPLLTGYFVWKRRLDTKTLPGWPWRSSRRESSPTSIHSLRVALPRGCRCCICRSRSGSSWASRTQARAGARWPDAWTSFDSRASSSSTTC